jgi:hypothetical protein
VIPPRFIKSPAAMKSGMASSEKESTVVSMLCADGIKPSPVTIMATMAPPSRANATGTSRSSRMMKTPIRMAIIMSVVLSR